MQDTKTRQNGMTKAQRDIAIARAPIAAHLALNFVEPEMSRTTEMRFNMREGERLTVGLTTFFEMVAKAVQATSGETNAVVNLELTRAEDGTVWGKVVCSEDL